MPFESRYPPLDIPRSNLLSFLFTKDKRTSTQPLWIDAADPSHSLSPAQAIQWIKKFAVGLDNLGVGEGQGVMVFTPNHIYVPIIYLAAAGSKRFFTGANPTYTASEVAYQMKDIDASVVLVHPSLLDTAIAAAKMAGIPTSRLFQFAGTPCSSRYGVQDWQCMVASDVASASWEWDPLTGDASLNTVAAVNYSSGTTGLPKGVCITHHNLIANTLQIIFNKFYGTSDSEEKPNRESWLAFLPLYHAYSQQWTINIACRLGVPVHVMQKFVYADFLTYIDKYKVTTLQVVPPIIAMLSKRPETAGYNLSSLRQIYCGAAPLSAELQNNVSKQFKVVITQGWGMTESTCVGIILPGMENDQTGSIGYLLPNTQAILRDENDDEVSREGEPGEIWVRGPQIMLKYWKNEQATRESLSDGWYRTGDVCVAKRDKFWIVDRKKELIKVNGLQVAPAELEAILLESEHVTDAAVVGITVHGEELPRAYIALQEKAVGRTTAEELERFVAARVAKHKRLAGGIKFVPEVPRLPSGKIVRKLVRQWANEEAVQIERRASARL